MNTPKKLLMIAFHYPPVKESSGIQRTLKFSTYLRDHGWEPMILTVSPRAYERISDDQMGEIPAGMVVERAFGLDASRQLAVRGRYLFWSAQPDRWSSWWLGAVWRGLAMIRKYRPDALYSTYPIASAHLIALTLAKLSGLPWIADFRDSMTEPGYPADPRTWKVHRWLERKSVARCTRAIFTTAGTRDMYAERYPEVPPTHWSIIENGFDEENFRRAEAGLERQPLGKPGQVVLIHSGILYPQERDPRPFFSALREMLAAGEVSADTLQIVLRATGSDPLYREMLAEYGIAALVRLEPPVPYNDALREMLCADGLLLLQATMCNHQIPAKLYEYLRAGQPVFCLTDPAGNTAQALRSTPACRIVDIRDAGAIRNGLREFLAARASGQLGLTPSAIAAQHSRRSRTAELAAVLEAAIADNSAETGYKARS